MTPHETTLDRAKEKLKLRDYATAERLVYSVLKTHKDHPQALFVLGNLYHNQGKFDRAVVAYKKALSVKSNFTEAALSLSILYNDLGRYEEGRLIFNRVKQQVPSRSVIEDSYLDEKLAKKHLELGELYEKYKRYSEAKHEYQKALKLQPQDPQTIVKIAQLHEKQGSTQESVKKLRDLIALRPDYIPGHIKLGLAYYGQGKMIEALREWEKVLDIEPQNKDALMYLDMAQRATTTIL